jgi:O-antigen biosynthesis protein
LEVVKDRSPVAPHRTRVDLIICVRSSLDVVKHFLPALIQYTSRPYALIMVDDGNDDVTRVYLADFALAAGAMLLRTDCATGFASAAVLGLRHSNADYVVILNSDVDVSPGWLERMVACAAADERIGLVGPLSNYDPQHSLPEELRDDRWATNPLPNEAPPAVMAAHSQASGELYPRLTFLPGFCLMIKRAVINEVGHFDEASFGEWFMGEQDYRLRASQAGWQLALADDVYVSYRPT